MDRLGLFPEFVTLSLEPKVVRIYRYGVLTAAGIASLALFLAVTHISSPGDSRRNNLGDPSGGLPGSPCPGTHFAGADIDSEFDAIAPPPVGESPSGRVALQFVDFDGAPLPWLGVSLFLPSGRESTNSDSEGRVCLESRPSRVRVDVADVTSWFIQPEPLYYDIPPDESDVRIVVPVGWIRGRVFDGYGSPVPGAQIHTSLCGATYMTTNCAADGRFSICVMQGSQYSLSLTGNFDIPNGRLSGRRNPGGDSRPPLATTGVPVARAGDHDLVLTFPDLDARGTLRVQVRTEEGTPLAGLTVAARPTGNAPTRTVTTDADGMALIDRLPIGPVGIHAGLDATDPRRGRFYFPELTLATGDGGLLTLQVRRCRVVRGCVRDESGRPVPGASLRVQAPDYGSSASSDAEGCFEVFVPPPDVADVYVQVDGIGEDNTNAPPTDVPVLVYRITPGEEWIEAVLSAPDR
ncbi:MAG: carboxypeptidase regulatory-like domain-containing protein [Planctomycetes bacterium]|nr:carboxypeptidase regulatory-like domain-containing protein [Planctomycetota bacterium]